MAHTRPNQGRREVMAVEPSLEVLANLRTPGEIVVTNQIAARLWPHFSNQLGDVNYNPSTMGGAVPLALGLALARPDREVIVISGEGALLMSLGSLVTVVDSGATNLTVIALDNAAYEVTGGQRTPASANAVDFAGIARAVGFRQTAHFWQLDEWTEQGQAVFSERGPRFIWLEVQTRQQEQQPPAGPSLLEQLEALARNLRAE